MVSQERSDKEKLEHLNQVLRAIRNVNQLITKEKDRDRLLKGACDELIDTRGYNSVWIGLLDESGALVSLVESGLGEYFPMLFEQCKGDKLTNCARRALRQSDVVVIEDIQNSCLDCSLAKLYQDRGALSTRLQHGNKVYGLLTASIPNAYIQDKEEQMLFKEVAGDIGFALYNIELEEKHQRAEAALRESEEFSSSLLENAPNPIISINPDTSIRYVNPAFEKLTGFTLAEITGIKIPHPWWLEEQKEEISASIKKSMASSSITRERHFRKKNGELFWVEMNMTRIVRNGVLQYHMANWFDITGRKQAEEKHQAIIKTAIDGFWLANLDGQLLEVNDSYCQMIGYEREELLKMSIQELEAIEAPEETVRRIKKIMEQGYDRFETQHKCKDGRKIDVEISVNYLDVGQGQLFVFVRDITERKKMEEAMANEAIRRRILIEQSRDGIVILNDNGKVYEANHRFAEMLGYSSEEVSHLSVFDWEYLFPRERVIEMIRSVNESGDHFETRHRRKDGSICDVEISTNAAIFAGQKLVFCVCRDITGRKQAEEALKESEEFNSSLLEQAPNPINVIHPDTSIKYVNPAFEKLTGFTLAEIAGMKTPHPWWPEETRDEKSASLQKALANGSIRREMVYQKKNGERFWVEINAISIVKNGTTKYFLVNWLDITGRKQMEEELRAHRDNLEELVQERTAELSIVNQQLKGELAQRKLIEKELIEARDAADAANQAKSEFLARMSHEIRTPIHGVMGTLDLVLDTELGREQHQYVRMARASADSLLNVINDILDFSKIEAGKMELEHKGLDLRATVDEALEIVTITAHKKGLELICQVSRQVPAALVGDAVRLRQILVNLLSNAVKFTEHGEVVVLVSVEDDNETESKLHFTISDTGIGIPKDKQGLLFHPFQQLDGSSNRKYGGTGLGLIIARQFVQMMNGHIWVVSEPGQGSTFHFTAKFRKQATSHEAERSSKIPPDWRGMPLLLVDDNATSRLILRELLSNWGFQVTEAGSGNAALQELENAKGTSHDFHIVLLDKTMPTIDGFAVAEQIRCISALKPVIIMMLPSDRVSDDFARCQELGMSDYLIKPVKETELLNTITKALGHEKEVEKASQPVVASSGDIPLLRILVAEDNATSQLIAKRTIEKAGHTVQIARNGLEVTRMVKDSDFDLVLMDVEMPEMNGLEATRLIRKAEGNSGRHIPVVAMTAYAMKEDREKCLQAGMDAYLSKPVNLNAMHELIRSLPSVNKTGKNVSPVDLESALRMVGGDKEILQDAVSMFLEQDYPEQREKIEVGIRRQDTQAVRIAAHAIKGATISFGGRPLADAAQRLEQMGRNGDLTGAEAALHELQAELKRFTAFFSRSGLISNGELASKSDSNSSEIQTIVVKKTRTEAEG